jgi:hypothetical protein
MVRSLSQYEDILLCMLPFNNFLVKTAILVYTVIDPIIF